MPEIGQLATPGDLTQVNIESLLALRPQVVFVANYAPPAMIAQIQQAGIGGGHLAAPRCRRGKIK